MRACASAEEVGVWSTGTAGHTGCTDAVRICPWCAAVRALPVRTYSGQIQVFTWRLEEFGQVSGYSDGVGVAVCKTVGSAYVGSNPTPATSHEP
jgi:hypothetical protein